MIDKQLLNVLACPICKAKIALNNGYLVCHKCSKKYPIKNGIPIMLPEEALNNEENSKK